MIGLENHLGVVLPEVSAYRIISMDAPLPEIRIVRLQPVEGKPPPVKPGQFVFLHIMENGKTAVRRAYSIASSPSDKHLEFAIELVGGEFTGRLEKMAVGDTLGVEGPVGHMVYAGQEKAAFICGGTGISPFIGILRHIADSKTPGDFVLFYSVRSADGILYRKELASLQKRHPGIKAVITITREAPPSWKGEKGRIDAPMILRHVKRPGEYFWFICGSPALVKGMRECLAEIGADPKKLRMEGW